MSPLTIRVSNKTSGRVNLFGVVPNRFSSLSLDEIRNTQITINDQAAILSDVCEVIDGRRDELTFEGDLSRCDYVGGGLESGRIVVQSDVGDFLAAKMSGGQIDVSGSAGQFACSSLKGGVVIVRGNCGPNAAAAAPGTKRGMNGGTLVIHGECGQWLGTRMRRGTVIVRGRTAAACATRLIAGTIVLCGPVDYPIAADMRRGTILMLGHQVVCTAPAGFTEPEHTELSFLQMLLNDVAPHLLDTLRGKEQPPIIFRSIGDRISRGQGEVIWINSSAKTEEPLRAHA